MSEKHKIIERSEHMTAEERKAMNVNKNGSRAWYVQIYGTDIHNRPDLGSTETTVYHYHDGTSVTVKVKIPPTTLNPLDTPSIPNVLALPEGLAWIGTEDGSITIGCRNEPGKLPEWIPFQPQEESQNGEAK